jgi:hypothetical protein
LPRNRTPRGLIALIGILWFHGGRKPASRAADRHDDSHPGMRAHVDAETTRRGAIRSGTSSSTGKSNVAGAGSSARRSGAMPGSRSIASILDVPDAEDRHNSIGRDLDL